MATIKAKLDNAALKKTQKLIERLERPVTKKTAQKLGSAIVREMKSLISKGNSPISGAGRFPKYKNPKRYPGSKKPHRPVNLKLTGDFLKSLKWKVVTVRGVNATQVGYFSDKQSKKEQGHREGSNSQPKRPTIPKGTERFARRIQLKILEILQSSVKQARKGR